MVPYFHCHEPHQLLRHQREQVHAQGQPHAQEQLHAQVKHPPQPQHHHQQPTKRNHVENKYLISRSSHCIIREGQLSQLTHNGSPNTVNIAGQISNYSKIQKGTKKGPVMEVQVLQQLKFRFYKQRRSHRNTSTKKKRFTTHEINNGRL